MATEFKLSYTANDINIKLGKIDNLAEKSEIPTKISDLTNDSGYLTAIPSEYITETELNAKGYLTEHQSLDGLATEAYVDEAIANIPASDVSGVINAHNTATDAHNDIRDLITGLTTRLNTLANSTDEDLDQMAEIVAYIKSNKSLIDSITTSKVNVYDIINNLTTNVSNKPLSAAQGVVLKGLIDALDTDKLDASSLTTAINDALAQAKASGEFDGEDGHTPVRGIDYWTEDDIAEIKSYVDEAILGGAW